MRHRRFFEGECLEESIGTADVEHLRDEAKKPLDDDEPPYGVRMPGFVKCRSIRQIDQQTMLIDLPSADVVHVPAGELVEVQC